ncbi:MAG: hypothetical protein ACYTXE_25650, partial [Nostoc sp.]
FYLSVPNCGIGSNGTKKSYKLCPNWLRVWRLGTHSRRAAASSGLTRGSSPLEYIPSLKTGNEVTQAFRLFLVPFGIGSMKK